jgi:hypothetical protein
MNWPPLHGMALLAAIVAPACLDDAAVDDLDLATTARPLVRNPADPPMSRGPAALDLLSGHHAKLPVSWFFTGTKTVGTGTTGAHTFQVKTFECSGDTGIFVRGSGAAGGYTGSWYNDDGPIGSGGAGGTSPDKGSEVTARGTGLTSFTVYVFSQTRATAFCSLWFRIDGGAWQYWMSDHFGGALVELGALRAGDFVRVDTDTDGGNPGSEDDTQMLVFDVTLPATRAPGVTYSGINQPVANDNRSFVDRDPLVQIPAGTGASWSMARPFALIGKTTRTATVRGVETHVEVTRGPLNEVVTDTLDRTTAVTLQPGRYTLWVEAATDNPVGSLRYVDNPNRALTLPRKCDTTTETFSGKAKAFYRGQLNDPGFTMAVMRLGSGGPRAVVLDNGRTERKVPLGAFGSEGQYHRFAVSFDVATAGAYQLVLTDVNRRISVDPSVHLRRNVDSTELKLANINMFYVNISVNEPRNAADLLATRGTVHPQTFQVEERPDQAPYQWQADVVAMTEVHPGHPADFTEFRDEAQLRNAPRWAYRQAVNEEGFNRLDVGRGGVLVSERLWPTHADPASIAMPGPAMLNAGCTFPGSPPSQGCPIWDNGDHERHKHVIPARLRVSRHEPTADRPITVVQLHLHTWEDSGAPHRYKEIESTMGVLERLLDTRCTDCQSNATAFNKDNDPDPLARGNRIILVGDFNTYTHHCGEHYYLLRLLREKYGYAVDVALAAEGSVDYSFGMHNYDGRTTNGVPWVWQMASEWIARTVDHPAKWALPPQPSGLDTFPWWSRSFRGETASPGAGNDRYDMIVLVGRGWELDDPVRSYTVMQDNDKENPFAVRDPSGNVLGGVEMFHDESGNGGIPNTGMSYNPNYSVGAGTGPGRAALQTDHRPILARLRVMTPGTTTDR